MDDAADPVTLANHRALWVSWCPAMETSSSAGPRFSGAELASAWGCGGCWSYSQILEVARDLISCPTRAHPCTGTTAAAVLEPTSLSILTH